MAIIIIDENDYLVSMRLQNKLHQCGSRDTTSNWSTLFYRNPLHELIEKNRMNEHLQLPGFAAWDRPKLIVGTKVTPQQN